LTAVTVREFWIFPETQARNNTPVLGGSTCDYLDQTDSE
jgi:hypothetical protein